MPRLVSNAIDRFRGWVGITWVCPVSGDTWELEASDLENLVQVTPHTAYLPCPCGSGKVKLESDQRDGNYLAHS